MKFNPDHDPDPIRKKFITVDSITDIPEDIQNRIGLFYETLLENLEVLKATSIEQMEADSNEDYSVNEDSLIKYLSLMGVQIATLQTESENLWRSVLDLTESVNEIISKLNSNGDS